jgi:hypothetical protein
MTPNVPGACLGGHLVAPNFSLPTNLILCSLIAARGMPTWASTVLVDVQQSTNLYLLSFFSVLFD